jgi:hypothetical protein
MIIMPFSLYSSPSSPHSTPEGQKNWKSFHLPPDFSLLHFVAERKNFSFFTEISSRVHDKYLLTPTAHLSFSRHAAPS